MNAANAASPVHLRLEYSEALVRRVVRTYLGATLGPGFRVAAAITVLATLWLGLSGDRSWFLGFCLVASLCVCVAPLLAYRAHVRQGLATIARLPTPHSDFTANVEGFTVANPVGHVTLPWRQLRRILRRSDYWLLLFAENQFLSLPLTGADPQDVARLQRLVEGAGVRLD